MKSPCARLHPLACAWAQSKVLLKTVAGFLWPTSTMRLAFTGPEGVAHGDDGKDAPSHRMPGASQLLLQFCTLQTLGAVPGRMLSKAGAASMAASCICRKCWTHCQRL